MLFKKTIFCLLLLLLFACQDQGCTEADDFGEFTTNNLQFPQYTNGASLNSDKSLCDDYNKSKLNSASVLGTLVEVCVNEQGVSITKNCAKDVSGDDNQCSIHFQSECPSASYAEFRKACFAKYASTQTSQGGPDYVIAKNDTNNPNFYLLPKADVSVKIRGEISMQRAGANTGQITINKGNTIFNNNSFEVQSGQMLQILLSNKVASNFFDFSVISGNLVGSCLEQSGGGSNVPLWRGNFLDSSCLSDFQSAQQLINNNYSTSKTSSDTIQDGLKKIIVYKTPYVENTKATAPSPENWRCDSTKCLTDSNSEDNKSDALKIDNQATASKRKLGVGFVLANNENIIPVSITSAQTTSLTTIPSLVEYYKPANCVGSSINKAATTDNIITSKTGSTTLNEAHILPTAVTGYVFTSSQIDCSPSPMLSVRQEISGFVEIGFIKVDPSTLSLPTNVAISIVNANGEFEYFASSNSKIINLKSCSSSLDSKCISFSSSISQAPASVFVRKGQTLLIHTDANMTIEKIKQFGLFVKTLPSPAIYCPSSKKFRMQRNMLCSTESGDSANSFCKIGPEKCQILPVSDGSSPLSCQCANDANFRRNWFSKFGPVSSSQDGYQLTTDRQLSTDNCGDANIPNCTNCLNHINSISQKKLYSSFYETVCFDLERYQGKTSDAKSALDNLNADLVDLNAIQLAEELLEDITILSYFSAEKNYGILPKPTLSAFPNDTSASPTINSKLQLESTINSNSAGKIAVFVADNQDVLNQPRASCTSSCEFNITSNSSITLRNGEGLKISLVNNDVAYNYGTGSCNILLNNKKSTNCPDPDLYTLKSGNLMRNSTSYNVNNPFNVCRKGDTLHPLASAYQEIFCYNGEGGVFVENDPQQTKEQAKLVGLKFELDTQNPNIFFKNCYIDGSGNHTTSCQAQCATPPCVTPVCDAMKILNPNFGADQVPNTKIGGGTANYYTCIREAEIVKAVAGSYNISVAVKNEKDIIDYIDIILTPILDLLYSGEKDCSIPLIDGQPTITPSYCEKNSNNCNGKTYVVDSNNKYISSSQSTPPALYCSMTINDANEITNANVNNSQACAQCRPVRVGEIERIYEVILNSNNFSNAVRIATILMVMFYGLTYLMGVSKLNQVEMANRIFKIGILGLFLDPQSGWLWFNSLIVQPFNNGADYLSFLFASVLESSESKDLITALNNGDYSNKSLLFATTNDIINLFLQDETWKKVGALFFFDLFGPIYALGIFYIIWIYVFVVANVLLVYVVAKLLMGVLFLVGPVFIVFFLFEKTKDYFKKWINTILSYAFQQFFVIFTLNFFNMLIYHLIKLVLGFKVCWDEVWNIDLGLMNFTLLEFWTPYSNPLPPKLGANPSLYQSAVGVPTVSAILCLYAIVHIMKSFMPQIAELANAITEGAYNAVNGGSLIGKSMKSIYQSGKKAFLNSYPVKTTINAAKSVAYKGLDKALGVGPDAEKRKEKEMKHRKEMLEDRDSISATANKKLAEFKTQNALNFASGESDENTLKTARAGFLNDTAKEKELERGLKILGISKSQYDKLKGNQKTETEKKARSQAKKDGFSKDDYLTDKGVSMKDFKNHSSLAGIMFTGFKEGSHKGGTLTKSLLEKNDSKQYDPKISRRDFENIRRTNPDLLKEAKNVRENSFYEHSQQAQDYVAYRASKMAKSFKNDVFNPSMNNMAGAMKNSGAFGAVGMVGGVFAGGVAGAFGGATGLVGAGAVFAGAGIFGAVGVVSGVLGGVASPVVATFGGIYGSLTGKGFKQGAKDAVSSMFKNVKNQFALSKFLASSSVGMAKYFGKHGLSSVRNIGVGATSGVGILFGGVAGAATGAVHGFFSGGAQGGISAYAKSTKGSRLSTGFAGFVGVAGGAVGGAVAGIRIGAVSGVNIVNNLKNKPSVSKIINNIKEEAANNNRAIGDIGKKSADIGFAGARKSNAGISYLHGGTVSSDIKSSVSALASSSVSSGADAIFVVAGLGVAAGAAAGATISSPRFRDTVRNSVGVEPIKRFGSGIKGGLSLALAAPPIKVPLSFLSGFVGGVGGALRGAVGGGSRVDAEYSRSRLEGGSRIGAAARATLAGATGAASGAATGARSGYDFIADSNSPLYTSRLAPLYSPEEMQRVGKGGEGSTVKNTGGNVVGGRSSGGNEEGDYGVGEKIKHEQQLYTTDGAGPPNGVEAPD